MKKYLFILLLLILAADCYSQYSWTATSIILNINQKIRLQNGQYDLILQTDNNLVLYQGSRAIWSTNTVGSGASKLIFQNDGNLVLYTANNIAKWSSNTSGNPGSIFWFQQDGNLVIYRSNGSFSWRSNTAAVTNVFPISNFNTNTTAVNTRIISNHYPTDDIVVVDYDAVVDFGADNTGISDASFAINSALSSCSVAGGGTVWLPLGKYRVSNPITIPENCTLRGDWNDPDETSVISSINNYGTTILVDFPAGEDGNHAFTLTSNSGILGLTIYYPNQNSFSPIPYNFSINCIGNQCCVIKNITLINAFKGIKTESTDHEVYTFKNIKGTCLKTGIFSENSADADVYEDITLNNFYWSNSPAEFNPPQISDLNSWTRANATGLQLSQLEWAQFLRVSLDNYNVGLRTIPGPRIPFVGAFTQLNISNCNIGVQFDNYDTRWGPCFANCFISGSIYAVKNNISGGNVLFNKCVFNGDISGSNIFIESNNPSEIPPISCKTQFNLIPKTSREVLYNVGLAPYNAPRVMGNYQGCLPTIDATSSIQQALNQAGLDGGGVVYLPPGWYRLDGNLSLPSNVEIRGSSSIPQRDVAGTRKGTTLFVYNDYNSSSPNTNTAFITINGETAGISGLKFFYPNRNFRYGDFIHPYTIRGNGSRNYIKNVSLSNSYNGIDFSTNICNDYYIERVIGMGTKNFISIGGGSSGGVMKNILSNPTAAIRVPYLVQNWLPNIDGNTPIVVNYTKANEQFITVTNGPGQGVNIFSNVFGYGAKIGVVNLKPETIIFNSGNDNLGNGYGCIATEHITILNLMRYHGYGAVYGFVPNGYIQVYNINDLPN
jgi:hypothetical protein